MNKITRAVGRGVVNPNRAEVELVQKLLNSHRKPPLPPLAVDGQVGPKTIAAIEEFQRRVVKMTMPDGRVDPDGRTLLALAGNAAAPPPPPAAGSNPTLLTPAAAAQQADPSTTLSIGGIWGEVKAGETWLGTDGERLVLSASPRGVVFLLKPRAATPPAGVYQQSARGFVGEVTTYPWIEGARRAASSPFVKLVEW